MVSSGHAARLPLALGSGASLIFWLLIFVAGVAAGLAVLYYVGRFFSRIVDARRQRANMRRSYDILKALHNLGFTLKARRSRVDAGLLQAFEIGQRGEPEKRGVMDLTEFTSANGSTIQMMDYVYMVRQSISDPLFDYPQTVVLIEHPDLSLPHFHLTREVMFHWAKKLWRVKDIDFAEHPKFSEMFHVRGEDETAVRALLTPQIRSALEQHPGLTIEGLVTQIVIFREKVLLPADKWPGFLAEATEIGQLFLDSGQPAKP